MKTSKKKRVNDKFKAEEDSYDSFMDKYFRVERESSTHPLFICSKNEYNLLKDNAIILGNPTIIDEKRPSRKIQYDIVAVGKNVCYSKKETSMEIKLRNMKKNTICILIHRKFVKDIEKIQIYKYTNGKIHRMDTGSGKYVVLMICTITDKNWKNKNFSFDANFLSIIKNNCPNQIRKQGAKHFSSQGHIYSIGYAAKYDKVLENNHSFSKYVQSK